MNGVDLYEIGVRLTRALRLFTLDRQVFPNALDGLHGALVFLRSAIERLPANAGEGANHRDAWIERLDAWCDETRLDSRSVESAATQVSANLFAELSNLGKQVGEYSDLLLTDRSWFELGREISDGIDAGVCV